MRKPVFGVAFLFLFGATSAFSQLTATISVSPSSFSFSAVQGGPLPASQTLQISNSGSGTLNWTISSNVNWLAATPASGSAPYSVTVAIIRTNLPPNTYTGKLTILGNATNSPQEVTVIYTVTAPITATISFSPPSFSFNAVQDGPLPTSQTLQISNSGSGTLNWTISSNVDWLAATPASGSVASGSPPINLTVAIIRTNLPPNTYTGKLTILGNATNSPQEVNVTYTVTAPPQPAVISLSPLSFNFSAEQNGSLPLSQNLQITNSGGGALNWSVSKKHNATWLSAGPANGTAPSSVTVSITTTGLVPNTYVDTLVISAAGASNSPQQVPVVYVVSTPPQPAEIFLSPTSFNFSAYQSGELPLSQNLQITNTGGGTLNWSISEAHNSDWLSATPVSGTAPSSVTVSITRTNLPPGIYVDTLVVSSGSAGNSPQRAPVVYTVSTPPTPAEIFVSPTLFDFSAIQSGPVPFTQELQIDNVGGGTLNWSISKARNSVWLGATPGNGTAPSTVNVAITTTGLVPDTYYDTLVITSGEAGNSPVRVPVAYTVFPAPSILATPESLLFTGDEGGANPASQLIFIDVSDPSISWSVSKSESWLGLTPVADTGNGQVSVFVNLGGLVAGDYFDTVVVTAPSAANSPRKVPVHLHLGGPVLSPASLQIFPTQLDFYAQRFDTIPSQDIDISNGGQLPLNWSATILHGAGWLSINPPSGTDAGTITVSVTTDLSPLTYVDTVKIDAPGAVNAPRFIPVRLNVTTAVGDEPGNRPRSFALFQNYPNPFNPTTKIDFALPRSSRATLEVFNVVGQRIRVLVDGELPAGPHSVIWDGRETSGQMVGSGIYFYRLKSQSFSEIKRMVFLK